MIWFTFSQDHSNFFLRIDLRSKGWLTQDQLEAVVVIEVGDEEDLDGMMVMETEKKKGFRKYAGGRVDGTSWSTRLKEVE